MNTPRSSLHAIQKVIGLKAVELMERTLNRKIGSDVIKLDNRYGSFAANFSQNYNQKDILIAQDFNKIYDRSKSYENNKLENTLFTITLNLYFEKHNASVTSAATHLGLPATSTGIGALAVLRATANPSVKGREFYGFK
ncbi:hypothetical protein BJ944DRAFT_248484 [Cunninghamella echinulata]|nr:hypothetical protein BJ944DRAFT_248484 [Cunninghamella echinulata]